MEAAATVFHFSTAVFCEATFYFALTPLCDTCCPGNLTESPHSDSMYPMA